MDSATLDILSVQLLKPQVWLTFIVVSGLMYAIFRFGRSVIHLLDQQTDDPLAQRFLHGLGLVWLAFTLIAWAALGVRLAYLPIPVLFELGSELLTGLRHSAGQFVVILALAMIGWRLVGTLSKRIVPDEEFNRRSVRVQTLKGVVESTLKVVIFIIASIATLQTLNINATSLLAGVSVLGVAVGFGAQSLVKDLFSGFFILLEDQYGVGDVISVNNGQLSGDVERLNLRTTVLRALDGTVHVIPNGQIATVSVSSKDWSRVVATIGVSYESNVDDALRVLELVCQELHADEQWSSFFLEQPDVQGVVQLNPDSLTLRALFKVQPKSQYALSREFNRRVKIAMDQAGIVIPYPQRTLHFGDGPLEICMTQPNQNKTDPRATQARTQAPVAPSISRDEE